MELARCCIHLPGSISADPGKAQVLGVCQTLGEKVLQLRFIEGRNPDWVHRPFFAKYDEHATWLNGLQPAFGESRVFCQDEPEQYYRENLAAGHPEDYE